MCNSNIIMLYFVILVILYTTSGCQRQTIVFQYFVCFYSLNYFPCLLLYLATQQGHGGKETAVTVFLGMIVHPVECFSWVWILGIVMFSGAKPKMK